MKEEPVAEERGERFEWLESEKREKRSEIEASVERMMLSWIGG